MRPFGHILASTECLTLTLGRITVGEFLEMIRINNGIGIGIAIATSAW